MDMAYELIWEHRGVVKRHYGALTANELLTATQQVISCEHFTDLSYIVNDFTDAEPRDISHDTIEQIAALRIGATFVNHRILSPYVATSSPGLTIAHALMQPAYCNKHLTRLFPNLTVAREWLAEQLKNPFRLIGQKD